MLIQSQKGKEFLVDYKIIRVDSNSGKVHWEAQYFFSKTGRKVHNRIKAEIIFKDGLIHQHIDEFHLHHWAAMALGWKGRLFGWTSFFKKKLQKNTNRLLSNFEENN
jgi:hypothetical protein